MANTKIIEKFESQSGNIDLSTWKMVLIDNLTPKQQELFLKRKKAIDLYFKSDTTVNQVIKTTGICETELRRFVKRCLGIDENGAVWGYRGLLPCKRLKSYERDNLDNIQSTKLTGAFSLLLDKYPKIQEKIIATYFNKDKKYINDPIIKCKYLHKKFIDWCHIEGIKEHEYPFNTKEVAKRSLYRFINKLENEYFSEAARRRGENVKTHANSTGIGNPNTPLISRPFQRVQFDGHRIDAMFSITFKTPEGDEITKVIDRIWLLAIIDVATRAILGYHISLNKEYSSFDVLQCIKNAIVPKEKMQLNIPELKYPNDYGFASLKIPETKWALWDEFLYDNAKANLAENVKTKLTQIVGCSINAGPVEMPERRGIIERFFGVLEENTYHRLPSTTGSNPKDPRRTNPEKKAIKFNISVQHLQELTEILLANYNVTPHENNSGFTPLAVMQQRIERGLYPRVMAPEKQNEIMFLSLQTQRTIKGSLKSGRRPYIYYEGVEYRNDVLSRSSDLVGKKLDILVNMDDLRNIRAFLPDGSEFGILTATGKWSITPHTLQTRKEINKLKANKHLHFTQLDDPIEIYQRYLARSAEEKKSDRTRLARLQQKEKSELENKIKEKNNIEENSIEQKNLYSTPINKFKNTKVEKDILTSEQEEKQKKIEELKKSKVFKTFNF